MLANVISVLYPAGELAVEFAKRVDGGEVADEELFAHGAEEAFDFSLGGTVAHGRVDEHGAEAGADGGELGGGVVRAVVDIHGLGHAALVEGGLEAMEEEQGVVVGVERAVWDDARGVVDEADEEGFDRFAIACGCGGRGGCRPATCRWRGLWQRRAVPWMRRGLRV